jgi:D-alanyl-D-alanine carboxypeptidase (penicillin-binding protein 5/6)
MKGRTRMILRCLLTNRSNKLHPTIFLFPIFFLFLFAICLPNSFAEGINSQAAVVIDASTGEILYAKNSDYQLFPASTTKLMTAIIVIEKANLSEIVTISQKAAQAHPFKAGFKKGDKVSIESLLFAALLKSANDAAVALAEAVAGSEESFVCFMNEKAALIGAANTRFINATGLPGIGQYITALDLSKIMKYAMSYSKLKEILATPSAEVSTEKGKAIFLKNTDKLLWSDEQIIGGKTGYTNSAKHCFVFAAERDGKIIIVSLLGSPTRKNLWKEAKKLADKGFQMIARQ